MEAYKESLRNNPKDDETRYNLALAQKLLKDQEQNQQNQDQNQDQNKEQEKRNRKRKIRRISRINRIINNSNLHSHRNKMNRCLKKMQNNY